MFTSLFAETKLTVEAIVAPLQAIIKQLEAHAQAKAEEAGKHAQIAVAALAAKEDAEAESAKADAVKAKIAGLLS